MSYKKKNCEKLIIGIDFGTDSCRALIVDTITGKEIAVSTSYYNNWGKGLYCNPKLNQYRHHPVDYVRSLEEAVRNALTQLPSVSIKDVAAIGIDTTASTIALTNKEGTPWLFFQSMLKTPMLCSFYGKIIRQ